MNDELFNDLPVSVNYLEAARAKYARAKADVEKAEEWADDSGEAVPKELLWELRDATRELAREERREMERAMQE